MTTPLESTLDADATPNYVDTDSDGDGIFDVKENNITKNLASTNGILTGADADADGLVDATGVDNNNTYGGATTTPDDFDTDGKPNYLDADADADGVADDTDTDVLNYCVPNTHIALSAFSPTAPEFCTGSMTPIDVTASVTEGTISSYNWKAPNNSTLTGTQIMADQAGTYNLTVTSSKGCSTSASVTVTENTGPSNAVLTGTKTLCNGASTDVQIAVTGGTSPFTAVLSDGTIETNYATGANISITPTANTTISIIDVTDAKGCSSAAKIRFCDIDSIEFN